MAMYPGPMPYERFWAEAPGLYVDSVVDGCQQTRVFSEHSNYLALLAGLGRGGRAGAHPERFEHIG